MKVLILLCLLTFAKAYTDLDDDLNLEAIMDDEQRFKTDIGCMLNKNPCNAKAQAFKNHMPEAVDDGCRECTDKERHLFKLFLKGMKDHYPADYKAYQIKYDPTGTHFPALLAELENF